MQMTTLGRTGISTSVVGFGCAGLFGLPGARERRAVLDAAYDHGVRHFDTAPMYGLGRCEPELGAFVRGRRAEVTIATKFGIEPSLAGRVAGRVQRPIRAVLARSPRANANLKESGRGPGSGPTGGVLYADPGFSAASAAEGLQHSLRRLGTDYLDLLMLHEPVGRPIADVDELAGFLDDQCRAGTIRSWGLAGDLAGLAGDADRLFGRAPVAQHPGDVTEPPPADDDRTHITFGTLTRALPALRSYLADHPGQAADWSARLGRSFDDDALGAVLLQATIRQNPYGITLYTTTRVARAGFTAAAAAAPTPVVEHVLDEITLALQGIHAPSEVSP